MSDIYKKIGQIIKDLRTNRPEGKLSQEQLANNIGVPANTLSRWETGTYKPTAENLDQLARFFNVSIAKFFPEQKIDDSRVKALTSATGTLNDKDFDEVVRYAEFRIARAALGNPKNKKIRKKK